MLHTTRCFSRDSDTGTEHCNKHASILSFKNLFSKHLLLTGCGLTDDAHTIPSCHLPVYSRTSPASRDFQGWHLSFLAQLLLILMLPLVTKRTEKHQGFFHSGHSESRGGLTPEYHLPYGIEGLWAPEHNMKKLLLPRYSVFYTSRL